MKLTIPKTLDWFLYLSPILLLLFGLAEIYTLTYPLHKSLFISQIIFGFIGIILMFFFTFFDYRLLKNLSWPLYLLGLILLVLVLVVGERTFGAIRWINLGFFQLQPSELFKIILVISLASFWTDKKEANFQNLIIFGFLLLGPILLVIRQPDLGTASVIFATGIVILLHLKLPKMYFLIVFLIILALLPLGYSKLRPYQKERLSTFLNPQKDVYGAGYNVLQSTIAVGSGGIFGQGFGQGTQSVLNFLPVAHTDFIFAGVAESTGLVGSTILLLLLGILIYRIIITASVSQDIFGSFLALGVAAIFLFQVLVNVGMNLGIMPITGIPLPFVSYGGSSLISSFIAVGFIQSIYLRHKKISF